MSDLSEIVGGIVADSARAWARCGELSEQFRALTREKAELLGALDRAEKRTSKDLFERGELRHQHEGLVRSHDRTVTKLGESLAVADVLLRSADAIEREFRELVGAAAIYLPEERFAWLDARIKASPNLAELIAPDAAAPVSPAPPATEPAPASSSAVPWASGPMGAPPKAPPLERERTS